jgi:hypothetical protein
MLFKLIVILFLVIIIYCLGSGLFFLAREKKGDATRVVKALTWRIALSIVLFILLFIAYAMGWIAPHTI